MILVALGANLAGPAGPPRAQLEAALAAFPRHGIHVGARSTWWISPAWPDPSDPPFVNGVVAVETALDPVSLLTALHAIERSLGRVRGAPNAPRPIDLDLVDFNGLVRSGSAPPELPHPRLANRAFVLRPLAEIAPNWRDPISGASVTDLLAKLPAGSDAEKLAPMRGLRP